MRPIALALLVALPAAGACRSEGVTVLPTSDLPRDVYGSPGPTPIETPEELPAEGRIYLVQLDRLRLRPVVRPLQTGIAGSLPEALMLELMQSRTGGRVGTAIPGDTVLRGVRVEGRVATVDLSSEFERPAPEPLQNLRIAQVVYTLTQEPTDIIAVRFAIDGLPRSVIGDVPLTVQERPVTRADYRQFAPPGAGA
jgi:hypothetical protein